ncbi:hypothetical protein B0H14DRAFT_2562520 [Mycena olivaceomarginata]|nr:hypothetical protein B0H14DRAFT_2562520 [Mycena olivaceomarginata]
MACYTGFFINGKVTHFSSWATVKDGHGYGSTRQGPGYGCTGYGSRVEPIVNPEILRTRPAVLQHRPPPPPTGVFYHLLEVYFWALHSDVPGLQYGEDLIEICDCPEYKATPVSCSQNIAPSFVISRSASAVSKGARKLKKKVSNIVRSISSGHSHKSKSTASVELEKAADSEPIRSSEDKHKWTSPLYTFFKDNVETVTDSHDGRKYQAFKYNAPGGCKSKSDYLGVKRYQTKVNGDPHSDRSSTSNLKKHAKHCWGADVVDARIKGIAADAPRDGSIFAAFTRSWTTPRQHQSSYPHQTGVSRVSRSLDH